MTRGGSRAFVTLLRLRLVPSALADVLAGVALAGGIGTVTASALIRTLVASACLYCGGMALNDVADAEEDARLGRQRPIVMDRALRPRAALLGACLLALGVVLAPHTLGWLPAAIAAGVLLYDFGAKRVVALGAVLLGACRVGNVALGWSAGGAPAAPFVAVGMGYGVYVALAVVHGWLEDHPALISSSRPLLVAAALAPFAVAPFLAHPVLASLAATPIAWSVLRVTNATPLPARTGTLLRGLARFTAAVGLGTGAWICGTGALALAYVPPWILRGRRWT